MNSSTHSNSKLKLFSPSPHHLVDEAATKAFAAQFAQQCVGGMVVYLQGELGAGKSTFARGFLQGLGYLGRVKSPTFTLIEPYPLGKITVYHFDLYRLSDPEELYHLGFSDYLSKDSICLIEWPQKAQGVLPAPDACIQLSISADGQSRVLELILK